jgi:hypothetical protein
VSQDRIIDGKDIWPLWSEQARLDLGDLDHPGAGQRPAGCVDRPTPRVMLR